LQPVNKPRFALSVERDIRKCAILVIHFLLPYFDPFQDGMSHHWRSTYSLIIFAGMVGLEGAITPPIDWYVGRVQQKDIGVSYPVAIFLGYILLFIGNALWLYSLIVVGAFFSGGFKCILLIRAWDLPAGILRFHALAVVAASLLDLILYDF
jgi:hypothetical protein